MPAEAPHQIDILHQRQRRKSADNVVERAADQQTLIAIRQRQNPTAPGNDPLQPACRRVRIIESKVEIAGAGLGLRSGEKACHRFSPRRFQATIRVQEQQPRAVCGVGTSGKLEAAAAWCGDDPSAGGNGEGRGVVGRAAIDAYDFAYWRRAQCCESRRETLSRIQSRYDDREA